MKFRYRPNKLQDLLLLLIILITGGCTPEATWQWRRAEAGLPRQVVTLAIAADPGDAAHLWAGAYSQGGLARSIDGGQTWQKGASGLDDNPIFDLLAQANGSLWAATRDGLHHSVDGGLSWQPITANLPPVTAFALAADEANRLYTGLDGAGLYVKSSGQDTWTPLANHSDLALAGVLSVAVSPSGEYIYAGTAARGIFASQDGGKNWVPSFGSAYVPNLDLNPEQPGTAIASLRNQLVRTHDGGGSWQVLPLDWAAEEIVSLLWAKPNSLWAGSGQGQIYHSSDQGDTWTLTGAVPGGGVLDLTLTEDQLLAATWTGIYASTQAGGENYGQDWVYISPSLGPPNANTLLASKTGLLLGTRAGLFRRQPGEATWQPAFDAFPPVEVTVLSGTSNDRTLYAATDSGLYRSDDGGATWSLVPADSGIGFQSLVVDPTNESRLYKLAVWERVYKSEDGGQTWLAQWNGLDVTTEGASLAIDPAAPSTLYLGSDVGLYRSRQGGDNWQGVAPDLADQSILTLVVQPPSNPEQQVSTLYLGATRGLYRSFDGGETVEQWGQGMENISVTALLFQPDNPQHVYAGTAFFGVYQSTDGGQHWQPIGPTDLQDEIIRAMAWGPGGELFVATPGGVWLGEN